MQKTRHTREAGEKLFAIIFIYEGGESHSVKLILKNSSVYLLPFHRKRYTDNAKADLLDGIKWKAMYHTKLFLLNSVLFLFSSPFSFSNLGLRIFSASLWLRERIILRIIKRRSSKTQSSSKKNEEFNKYFLRNTTSAKNTRAWKKKRNERHFSCIS